MILMNIPLHKKEFPKQRTIQKGPCVRDSAKYYR
jgi:hypothetical protein